MGQTPTVYDAVDPLPSSACIPSSLQPTTDLNVDAGIKTNKGLKPSNIDKSPSESRLPICTAYPTIATLEEVLLRSRTSLSDEYNKHDGKAAPERNEVLMAKNKVDTLAS
jgi:hypothetical protein